MKCTLFCGFGKPMTGKAGSVQFTQCRGKIRRLYNLFFSSFQKAVQQPVVFYCLFYLFVISYFIFIQKGHDFAGV